MECLQFAGRLGSRRRELIQNFFEQQFALLRMSMHRSISKLQLLSRASGPDARVYSQLTSPSTGTRRVRCLQGVARRGLDQEGTQPRVPSPHGGRAHEEPGGQRKSRRRIYEDSNGSAEGIGERGKDAGASAGVSKRAGISEQKAKR